MTQCSLIIPIMRSIENGIVPDEVKLNNNGVFNFYENVKGLPYEQFSDVYIVYNKELEDYIKNPLNTYDFVTGNLHFCQIDTVTKSEPETIMYTITTYDIRGSIFIKDSDHFFEYSGNIQGNGIIVYSLEDMNIPIFAKNYSYVTIDDNMLITNMIEKRVISNMFNCGGYIFENADQFVKAYCALTENKYDEKLYISHIIYYLMLNENIQFKGFKANLYLE